jgi:hypothetical protein
MIRSSIPITIAMNELKYAASGQSQDPEDGASQHRSIVSLCELHEYLEFPPTFSLLRTDIRTFF